MRIVFLAAAIVAATSVSAQAPAASFCERLAPQLEMKEKIKGGVTSWEVNALGGFKTFLVGGSTMISFAMEPVGEPTVADYQRLQKTCAQKDKGIACDIDEPMVLKVQVGDGVAEVEALPGEKATVSTRKAKIYCTNQ